MVKNHIDVILGHPQLVSFSKEILSYVIPACCLFSEISEMILGHPRLVPSLGNIILRRPPIGAFARILFAKRPPANTFPESPSLGNFSLRPVLDVVSILFPRRFL